MALLRPDGSYFDGWAPFFQGDDPITWYESRALDVAGIVDFSGTNKVGSRIGGFQKYWLYRVLHRFKSWRFF